jgi:ferredoxin
VRIRVDTNRCSGHARCRAMAPEVYELDELGYNVTPEQTVPLDLEEAARRGAEACPEQAITIEEDGT